MSRTPTPIQMTAEERSILECWARAAGADRRYGLRSRIVLAAASGESTLSIARNLNTRPATVSKWRTRFARQRLVGLQDAPRPGAPLKYDGNLERRILDRLMQTPPRGTASWTGRSLARALGGISEHHVWRVLRRHGIQLSRRKDWPVRVRTNRGVNGAELVALYLNAAGSAAVLSPEAWTSGTKADASIGYVRMPADVFSAGPAEAETPHPITLADLLDRAARRLRAGCTVERSPRKLLDFMDTVVKSAGGGRLDVLFDGPDRHRPEYDRWLARHANVRFRYSETRKRWMEQMQYDPSSARGSRSGRPRTQVGELPDAIRRFLSAARRRPGAGAGFEWRCAPDF